MLYKNQCHADFSQYASFALCKLLSSTEQKYTKVHETGLLSNGDLEGENLMVKSTQCIQNVFYTSATTSSTKPAPHHNLLLPLSLPHLHNTNGTGTSNHLTNNQVGFLTKVVRWNLEVQWRRSLSYASRDIIMRAVARAEPSSEVAGFSDRDASQMCAYT